MYRQNNRAVTLKPSAVSMSYSLSNPETGKLWWSDGSVAWSEDILDAPAIALLKRKQKHVTTFPIDLFWPRYPKLRLEYQGIVEVDGRSLLEYADSSGKTFRHINEDARPPKFLWMSRLGSDYLVRGDEDNKIRLGRMRPTEDERNIALVDNPDPAAATFMVIPYELEPATARDTIAELQQQRVKTVGIGDATVTDVFAPFTIKVAKWNLAALKKKIDKLAATAARLNAAAPSMVVGEPIEIRVRKDGGDGLDEWPPQYVAGNLVTITIPAPIVIEGSFETLAKVTAVSNGHNTVQPFTRDNAKLAKSLWTTDMRCDHCGKVRRRASVFVVEDLNTGERKQIGTACLDDYTGHPAMQQVCALADAYTTSATNLKDMDYEDPEDMPKGVETSWTLEDVVSLAASNILTSKYVSRGEADSKNMTSTAEDVLTQLVSKNFKMPPNMEEALTLAKRAITYVAGIEPVSDFDMNMKAVASSRIIGKKQIGIACYIVPFFQKERDKQEAKATQLQAPGAVRTPFPPNVKVGDKIKVNTTLSFMTNYDSAYGTVYLYNFTDNDGYAYVWKTSSPAQIPLSFDERRERVLAQYQQFPPDELYPVGDAADLNEVRLEMARLDVDWLRPHKITPTDELPADVIEKLKSRMDAGNQGAQPAAWYVEELKKTVDRMDKRVQQIIEYEPKEMYLVKDDHVVLSGTVKELATYKDKPQVVMTRCKLARQAKPAPATNNILPSDYKPAVGAEFEVKAKEGRWPFTAVVTAVDGDMVSVSKTGAGASTKMPVASLPHFVNDLRGVVAGPPSTDKRIQAVLNGDAEYLGKGDDGLVFHVGKFAVKVSTTVPFQPFNPGHLTPQAAIERLRAQATAANEMADAGIPGIMRSEFLVNGDKAFQIKPYVEIPTSLTRKQLDDVATSVVKAHEAGWVFGDDLQVGINSKGVVFHFDTGKAHKSTDPSERERDIIALKRLFSDNNESYMSEDEQDVPSVWEALLSKDTLKMSKAQVTAHMSALLKQYDAMIQHIKLEPDTLYTEDSLKEDMRRTLAKIGSKK